MADVPFSCACGEIAGTLHGASPRSGNHVRCYCSACRAAVLYTTGVDPEDRGVELYQTTPDKISFQRGRGNLAVFSFSPKKLLRFRASCCGVPMFTMLPTPKFALAGMMTNLLDSTEAIGPVASEAFIPQPDGTSRHSSTLKLYGGTIWRAFVARVTGRWKQTSFFDIKTGKPVAPVYVPTPQERAKLPL
ncbi:hypothetical protein KDD17_03585 [Sulfitobacter albidus]|uniref:Uncharacterized protein n=1 Tax=Sulfitobacter albidus TaxID=2829501 RepID=A0A975PN59_9RHOB|nr:DUF6151 family protein [Sulfitobacter albidus]QUJ77121.1 hypothetical protein KDD17_03585 [Sulfitobacter albidus]